MSPLLFIAAIVLAVYAWAYTIALLPGPFDIFSHLRGWVDGRWGEKSWQSEGINCPTCISFWLSWLGAALIWWYGIAQLDALLYTMSSCGIWGAVIFLYRLGREQ